MISTFKNIFTPKWIGATLLVSVACGVMIRLGFWQLDRLAQRRAFNAHYLVQSAAPPLELNAATLAADDLTEMAYRQVVVTGVYEFSQEMAIRNQSWQSQPGVHLLTPLVITGTQTAVLVDRGWIPLDSYQNGDWRAFEEPGLIPVKGVIRLSQQATFGGRADPTPQPGEVIKAWNFVDLEKIKPQFSYNLAPVYVQKSPDGTETALPYPNLTEIEISAGPHLSYAIQWFVFTAILLGGYLFLVHKENRPNSSR